MKIGLEGKLNTKDKNRVWKYSTVYTGKDNTVKSVCVFEQLSRNKIAISCWAESASKLQVARAVTLKRLIVTEFINATCWPRVKFCLGSHLVLISLLCIEACTSGRAYTLPDVIGIYLSPGLRAACPYITVGLHVYQQLGLGYWLCQGCIDISQCPRVHRQFKLRAGRPYLVLENKLPSKTPSKTV